MVRILLNSLQDRAPYIFFSIGDLMYLDLPFQPIIIAGSAKVTHDLLEKRAHLYSDRPICRMDELYVRCVWDTIHRLHLCVRMSWDFNFALMPYGPEWRLHRRCFHQSFNQGPADRYVPVQIQEVRLFLQRALDQPGKLRQQTRL